MPRQRFPLTSEQLELLLAYEQSKSLQDLAGAMAKDSSVISRNLQRLADTAPVLVKVKGRWQLTPLGLQINSNSRTYLRDLAQILDAKSSSMSPPCRNHFRGAALIVINAQKGLLAPLKADSNIENAEHKIARIMTSWRELGDPIIHVKHVSPNPSSPFFRDAPGSQFTEDLAPNRNELVFEKSKSSAFSDTNLMMELNNLAIETLVIVGFTANECIDATARDAAECGFSTYVVSDATASFDVVGPDGILYRAERIHKLTLANIHALWATVISSNELLSPPL